MRDYNDIMIALDFPGGEEALSFLDRLEIKGEKPFVKVGMELFYACGPDIIREIKARGYRIFLDLKLHDIPNTVGSAMRVLAGLGVDMVNVHAAGGRKMMEAARKGLDEGWVQAGTPGKKPYLIAVTMLTSIDKDTMNGQLLIPGEVEETVVSYARNAREAGLDGVVCSPMEAGTIHRSVGEDFLTVTPGIRLPGDSKGDQKRVTTPGDARKGGSDFMVIGRSITRAEDPSSAYERCLR